MSNSIFDDDDGAFSLSSGFDGGEAPKAPKVATPKNQLGSGNPQTRLTRPPTAAPARPGLPASGSANVRKPLPKPATSTSGMPKSPNPVSSPEPKSTKLPSLPPLRGTGQQATPPSVAKVTEVPVTKAPEVIPEDRYIDEEKPPVSRRAPSAPAYAAPAEDYWQEEETHDYEQERRDRERRREREIARQREEERRDEERRKDDEARRRQEELNRRKAEVEEEEEEEEKVSSNKGRNAKTSRKNSKSKAVNKKTAKPAKESKYSGGRKKILILQITVYAVLGMILLAGAKTIFLPNTGPTPNQIIMTVKKSLGVTEFPTSRGEGFVAAFSDVYLTLNNNGVAERNTALAPYMPLSVIQEQSFQQSGPATQAVTAGPYVTSVKSVDNNNAVYTVATQINDGIWIYMDVPVYFDSENDSFAVSGSPAFTPAPEQAAVPAQPKSWTTDDKAVVDAFMPNAELFFTAWSKSDKKAMNAYITEDADTTASSGLNGSARFSRISSLHVEPEPEFADVSNGEIRKARISIVWENPYVDKTSYQQTYDLVLKKVADQWRIQSLNGGVPTEIGNDQK